MVLNCINDNIPDVVAALKCFFLLRLVKAVSQIQAINEGALQSVHCHCVMVSLCTFLFGIYIRYVKWNRMITPLP